MDYATSAGAAIGSLIPGIGTVVGETGGEIVNMFSSLFGGLTTQQEFQQWIIPIIYPEAQRKGCAVYVYWFGEIVGVTPSGQIVHFGSFPSLTVGYATLDAQNDYYETYGEFQSLNSSNHYQGGSFVLHGSGIMQQYANLGYQAAANPIVNAPATAPIFSTSNPAPVSTLPVSTASMIPAGIDTSTLLLIGLGATALFLMSGKKGK